MHGELPEEVKKRILGRTLDQLKQECRPGREHRLLVANDNEIAVDGEATRRIQIGKGAYPLPITVATEVTEVTMESTWLERINAK